MSFTHKIIQEARIRLHLSLLRDALSKGDLKKADEHMLRVIQIEKEDKS